MSNHEFERKSLHTFLLPQRTFVSFHEYSILMIERSHLLERGFVQSVDVVTNVGLEKRTGV